MKGFIKSKKGLALLAGVVAVIAAAGGAYAYFTNTGSNNGNPVAVGTAATNSFTIAFDENLSGAGGTLATAQTSYTDGGTSGTLLPTPQAPDPNADVGTVPFTISNNSEENEVLNHYTITIETSGLTPWTGCAAGEGTPSGDTPADTCSGNSLPVCSAQDFSINNGAVGTSSTVAVTGAPVDLAPMSDAPANSYAGTFTIQLVDNTANQDNCQGLTPPIEVSATSA